LLLYSSNLALRVFQLAGNLLGFINDTFKGKLLEVGEMYIAGYGGHGREMDHVVAGALDAEDTEGGRKLEHGGRQRIWAMFVAVLPEIELGEAIQSRRLEPTGQ
jgi:hypothetical protein